MILHGPDESRAAPEAFETFLSTLGERDRRNFRSHVAALWRSW